MSCILFIFSRTFFLSFKKKKELCEDMNSKEQEKNVKQFLHIVQSDIINLGSSLRQVDLFH